MRSRSNSASTLDLISQLGQFRHHFLTLVSLDFDSPILDCASRAAQLLEFLRHGGQLCFASHYPIDNCDGFPPAPFPVTHHTHNAIAFTSWLRGLRATAVFIGQSARGAGRHTPTIG